MNDIIPQTTREPDGLSVLVFILWLVVFSSVMAIASLIRMFS